MNYIYGGLHFTLKVMRRVLSPGLCVSVVKISEVILSCDEMRMTYLYFCMILSHKLNTRIEVTVFSTNNVSLACH